MLRTSVSCLKRNLAIFQHRFQSTATANNHFDVIVVGGGGVGLSLAGAIGKNKKLCDKRVLLLDGAPKFKGYNPNIYSNRVFAINHNAVQLMKDIGAWETIQSIRCQPVKQMQVWDGTSDALITFNHDDFLGDVAYIVENEVLLYAIDREIAQNENVQVQNEARVDRIRLKCNGCAQNEVHLKSGEVFTTDLLIGADGANSMVRKEMDVNYITMQYNQMGLISTMELAEPDENFVAWQRFMPKGVIALLPLSDSLSSIVWCTETDQVKSLLALPEDEFVDAVNHEFVEKNPRIPIVDDVMKNIAAVLGGDPQTVRQLPPKLKSVYNKSRAAFPLGFGHTSTYVRDSVALIGDAAHRVHPLAGMGLNLGFGDVKCLTDILARAAYDGYSLGNLSHLLEYETKQLRTNVPIMVGILGLKSVYGSDASPIVLARSIGLQLTQATKPLKKFFMERAMG